MTRVGRVREALVEAIRLHLRGSDKLSLAVDGDRMAIADSLSHCLTEQFDIDEGDNESSACMACVIEATRDAVAVAREAKK